MLTESRISAAFAESVRLRSVIDYWWLGLIFIVTSVALTNWYLGQRPAWYSATSSILIGNVATANERLGIMRAHGDVDNLTFKRFAARLQHARLESELAGRTVFLIPPALAGETSGPEYRSVVNREKQLFLGRIQGFAGELSSLRQRVKLYQDALASRTRQAEFAAVQQQSIDQEVLSVRALVAKGISTGMRLGDIERASAAVSSNKIEIETQRINLAQSVLSTEQDIETAKSAMESSLLSSLQQSAIEGHTIETQLIMARQLQSPKFAQPRDAGAIENTIAIIRSEATALAVVDTYDLATTAFVRNNRPGTFSLAAWLGLPANAADRSGRQVAAGVLQRDLRVTRYGRGSQIDVTFVSLDPETARVVADGVVDIFTKAEAELTGSTSHPAEIIQKAVPRLSTLPDAFVWALGLLAGIALTIACSMALSVAGSLRRDSYVASPGTRRNVGNIL